MSDYLVKALAYEGFVRAYAVNATETIAEAQQRHDTWNTSSAALGRTMIGALMLGATLKGEDKMTVKVEGNGPAGAIVVDSNGKGEVKGYIKNPHISLPLNEIGKIDVRGAVGTEGMFTVIKDLGLKEPFSGHRLYLVKLAKILLIIWLYPNRFHRLLVSQYWLIRMTL